MLGVRGRFGVDPLAARTSRTPGARFPPHVPHPEGSCHVTQLLHDTTA